MPYTTIVAGTYATASWANANVRDQTIATFASTTSRDANITVPVEGMVCFIGSNDANEGLYVYHGATGGWRKGPGWNAPWGVLANAKLTTVSATSSVHTTLQDGSAVLTTTATTVTNRLYKVTSVSNPYASGGANGWQCSHNVGGSAQAQFLIPTLNTVTQTSVTHTSTFTETSGQSRIFKVQIAAYNTNTAITDWGSATIPRILIVEDIGPAGAPA
jgi:hypothetical protein